MKPKPKPRPTFPGTDDLCNLSLDDAKAALAALRHLVEMDLATVYTSAGSHDQRWQVWLEITQRRVELPVWAAEWLVERDTPRNGGTAA